MSVDNRTIVLKGKDKGHHDEGILDTAAYPGTAIEMAADGHYDPIVSTKAESLKRNSLKILKEDDYQGKTIADQYAIADQAFFYIPTSGDHINLRVKSGETIAVDDLLVEEGSGSGKFVEAAGTEVRYRAIALESSGGALAADGYINCEWL